MPVYVKAGDTEGAVSGPFTITGLEGTTVVVDGEEVAGANAVAYDPDAGELYVHTDDDSRDEPGEYARAFLEDAATYVNDDLGPAEKVKKGTELIRQSEDVVEELGLDEDPLERSPPETDRVEDLKKTVEAALEK